MCLYLARSAAPSDASAALYVTPARTRSASDKVLSIKGGDKANTVTLEPDSSVENIIRSGNLVNERLRGTKRLDLFQCARVDTPEVPVKSEGKLDHIGMSECSAQTLRRGHKFHPISVVEIEVSPFSYEPKAREELGVAVAAYSPLGSGFLTGQIKQPEDIPEGDFRRFLPRFQGLEDNMRHNFIIVDTLTELAKKKSVTPAQLCIAWVSSFGPHIIPLPGSSHVKRTLENCAGGDLVFTEAELKEVNELIENTDVKGGRYPAPFSSHLWA